MLRIRLFEEFALESHRNAESGGYLHASSRQEAFPVGVCANLRIEDRITSTHRGQGHGQARASLVVRLPHGMLPGSAAQHSQTIENWFVNVPGLVVMTPATAADLAGMLKAAIQIDDPVLLFEPKALFKQVEDVPESVAPILPGKATVRRDGSDVTLVTWSLALRPSLVAAEEVEAQGISCEVIDLRSLWPWDAEAVAKSLAKTKRLLVVNEGVLAVKLSQQ